MATMALRARRLFLGAALLGALATSACGDASSEAESQDEAISSPFNRDDLFTGKWTNWHDRDVGIISDRINRVLKDTRIGKQKAKAVGLLKLSAMRDWLHESNLVDTNPAGKIEIIGGPGEVRCDERAKGVRTLDGTCNDLESPAMGAAHVRFGRNVSSLAGAYADEANLMKPSPREISRRLLARDRGASGEPEVKRIPFLNMLATSWIQFMNHDWFSHGAVERSQALYEIPLAADDPFRAHGMEVLLLPKTATRAPAVAGMPQTFFNETTHWWDGSQVYGSDRPTAAALRAHKRDAQGRDVLAAELELPDGYLPTKGGLEQADFTRNWWVGLSLMQTVFAREHNRIVAMLRSSHPELGEDDLYDHARMINAAVMARIHTVEWTPAVLPNPTLRIAMLSNWYGLATVLTGNEDKGVQTGFDKLAKWAGIKNAGLTGIVGSTSRYLGPKNVPFSLTEEFTSVYRLHSLLPEHVDVTAQGRTVRVPLAKTRNEEATQLMHQHGLGAWVRSFGSEHPGQLVLHNFPAFLQDIDMPGFTKYDVGTADILRDRERGVPRYNRFRELIQLRKLESIDELTTDPRARADLKAIYGDDAGAIDRVDLLVGTLAEGQEVRPESFGFGETMFQIFLLMASRRLFADRFFTDAYNEQTYTREGLDWVNESNFKTVLLRNLPELGASLDAVDNAFLPWDGSSGRDVPREFP